MANTDPSNKGIAEAFKSFPFATDQEYQEGLQTILASSTFSGKSNSEKEDTLRLSRVFYFNKITGNSITLEDASSFESSSRLVGDSSSTEQPQEAIDEIHTLSFSELRALIEQGKTDGIPNNRLIPNILNDAPSNEDIGQIRKKPWET